MPSFVTKSRPKNASPVTEIATVTPAKSTALPAEAPASAAASDGREPRVQELPEARDDEQRVVDPHAEPDHRDEERRDRVDVGEAREDEEQQERGQQRRECERDRDHPRDERAEDHEQHDQRGEEAEQFLRALLDRRELRVAVELDRHAGRLDARRALRPEPRATASRSVSKITRSNWASAYAMRPSSETVFSSNGSPTLSMPAVSSVGLNSEVLSFAIACSIAALRSGVSSCSPSGRGEDEVEHAALLGGELRLDQVGRLLRVGAGDVELVLQAPADRRDEHDQERPRSRSSRRPRARDASRTCAPSGQARRSRDVRAQLGARARFPGSAQT